MGFQEGLCPRRGASGGLDRLDTLPFFFRGSVSGAWRKDFPMTTSDDRRSGSAGNADSKDENGARRGAGGGLEVWDTLPFSFPK